MKVGIVWNTIMRGILDTDTGVIIQMQRYELLEYKDVVNVTDTGYVSGIQRVLCEPLDLGFDGVGHTIYYKGTVYSSEEFDNIYLSFNTYGLTFIKDGHGLLFTVKYDGSLVTDTLKFSPDDTQYEKCDFSSYMRGVLLG